MSKESKMKKNRVHILGYAATPIIMWMGKHNWNFEEALSVVRDLGSHELAARSIGTALSDGRNPKYAGRIPTLSETVIAKLKASRDKEHVDEKPGWTLIRGKTWPVKEQIKSECLAATGQYADWDEEGKRGWWVPDSFADRAWEIVNGQDSSEDDEEEEKPKKKEYDPSFDRLADRVSDLEAGQRTTVKELLSLRELQEKVDTLDKARRIEIVVHENGKKQVIKLDGPRHPAFDEVYFHLGCGDNVMLVGPRGCGKTYLAEQMAKAFSKSFLLIGCSGGLTESSLLGKWLPNDKGGTTFIPSGFLKAVENTAKPAAKNGWLTLLDELDGSDPNVVLCLNSLLANGMLSVPQRFGKEVAVKDSKCWILGAANTYGNGADRRYVGRNQLDAAFVDRFIFIAMDYDKQLERSLITSDDLLNMVWDYREKINSNRLERSISTRWLVYAQRWIEHGKDLDYCRKMLLTGWSDNDVKKVKGGY
jgi:hypothetical protein